MKIQQTVGDISDKSFQSKVPVQNQNSFRAFSDLFGKFLVPMKLGKSCVILGKKIHNLGKK